MTRSLSGGMVTEFTAQEGVLVYLIELQFGSGTIYLTTASVDISWNAHTWTAIGGALAVDLLPETTDSRGGGVALSLSGVDQTILALILGETYRGRFAKIYLAAITAATGAVVSTPLTQFVGLMNDTWSVNESRGARGGGTVDVSTRLVGRYADFQRRQGIRCNIYDHRGALRTAAPSGWDTDTFMHNTAAVMHKAVYWGGYAPVPWPTDKKPQAPGRDSPKSAPGLGPPRPRPFAPMPFAPGVGPGGPRTGGTG